MSVEVAVTASVKANHERITGDCECDILGFLLRQNKIAWQRTAALSGVPSCTSGGFGMFGVVYRFFWNIGKPGWKEAPDLHVAAEMLPTAPLELGSDRGRKNRPTLAEDPAGLARVKR